MKTSIAALLVTVMLAGALGCVSKSGRTTYSRAQANQALHVEIGTVLSVRKVVIDGTNTQVGTYGGGAVGAAAASGIGSGTGRALATAGGAVGGMIVGREVEKMVTRKEGLEITVSLDNGKTIIVVQDAAKAYFEDGDRVRVLMGPQETVVLH